MFVKKGEEKECHLQCSRSELLDEFLFQVSAVAERIGNDANLLAHDIAVETRDVGASVMSKGQYPRRLIHSMYHSICYSVKNVPRISVALYNLIIFR